MVTAFTARVSLPMSLSVRLVLLASLLLPVASALSNPVVPGREAWSGAGTLTVGSPSSACSSPALFKVTYSEPLGLSITLDPAASCGTTRTLRFQQYDCFESDDGSYVSCLALAFCPGRPDSEAEFTQTTGDVWNLDFAYSVCFGGGETYASQDLTLVRIP